MKNTFTINKETKEQILNQCKELYNALINGNGDDAICIDRRTLQISDFCVAFGREDLSVYQLCLARCYSDLDNDDEDLYSWEEIEKQIISRLKYYVNKPTWYNPYNRSFNLFMKAYHEGNYDYANSILSRNKSYWRGMEIYEANKLIKNISGN